LKQLALAAAAVAVLVTRAPVQLTAAVAAVAAVIGSKLYLPQSLAHLQR